jgi:hypothetical protein
MGEEMSESRSNDNVCVHCGPDCRQGAAHNARVEDGVFYGPNAKRESEELIDFVDNVLRDEERFGALTCGTTKAPKGWACSRELGHGGPCAARRSVVEDVPARGVDKSSAEKCKAVSRYGCMCVMDAGHVGDHDAKCGWNHRFANDALKCLATLDDTLDCSAPDCPCAPPVLEVVIADGATLIQQERQRQVESEHWTPENDDCHTTFELSRAALCYVFSVVNRLFVANWWPWDWSWYKPSDDKIRNLVKAGALLAAEIDRLQRRAAAKP